MSDKHEPSNSPDESEHQSLPAETGQTSEPGKPKSKRGRKSIHLPSNKDLSQIEENETEEVEEQDVSDDLLADIRRSLKEEEDTKEEKKKKGIFRKVAKIIKPGKASPANESKPAEIEEVPVVAEAEPIIEETSASGDENAPVAEADKTSGIDAESVGVENPPAEQDVVATILGLKPGELTPAQPQEEIQPQPEPEVEVKKVEARGSEVLQPDPDKENAEKSFEGIREVALVDYDDSAPAPEQKPRLSLQQRFRILVRDLKPLDKVLIFGTASLLFLAAIVAFGISIISFQIQANRPAVAVPTEDVPVPFRVTLPGGWDFKLSKGILVNDKWSPKGPEWLEGTELCRWVALPWSLQLEAVVRTLALDDPIILTMSNADEFEFKVKSIQNIPIDDINTLDSRSACLFLILVNPDSDTRWVVTAKP